MLTTSYSHCPVCQKTWEKDLISQFCRQCQTTQTIIGFHFMLIKVFDKETFLMWFSYQTARLIRNGEETELSFDPDPSVSLEGLQKLFNFL